MNYLEKTLRNQIIGASSDPEALRKLFSFADLTGKPVTEWEYVEIPFDATAHASSEEARDALNEGRDVTGWKAGEIGQLRLTHTHRDWWVLSVDGLDGLTIPDDIVALAKGGGLIAA